jgi:hypothetical protein
VKSYNQREQSRARTLQQIYEAIGERHSDLYGEFEKLLSQQ